MKWVSNKISFDEINDEIRSKYVSVFAIDGMTGTMNDKNRHVRVELLDKKEYEDLIHNNKISLFAKKLISGRCNQPGHTKNVKSHVHELPMQMD